MDDILDHEDNHNADEKTKLTDICIILVLIVFINALMKHKLIPQAKAYADSHLGRSLSCFL